MLSKTKEEETPMTTEALKKNSHLEGKTRIKILESKNRTEVI